MSTRPDASFERALRSILWHLRAHLGELVLIGGWVPYLYRRYGGFRNWRAELSGTIEVDLLVTRSSAGEADVPIPGALRAAGFSPVPGAEAIWERDVGAGERLEFMVPHEGPATDRGDIVSVEDQRGLHAISLARLSLLAAFATSLEIPIGRSDEELERATVRVPRLGAFVLNKACTFPYRRQEGADNGEPKTAKDILYVRDLMAAGSAVVERIEADVQEIAKSDSRRDVAAARNHIYLLLHGKMQRHLPGVAEILAERSASSQAAADADVRGHLFDLLEVLENALS